MQLHRAGVQDTLCRSAGQTGQECRTDRAGVQDRPGRSAGQTGIEAALSIGFRVGGCGILARDVRSRRDLGT